MEVSSYGGTATESSGLVRIIKDLSASIAGEDVLLVEDIIDTGLTLNYLVRYLRGKNPALAADLHPAGQAGAAARRDPGRLRRLRDPRPVRGGLRPGLRRALPQPALRGRAAPRGVRRRRDDAMHRSPLGRRAAARAIVGRHRPDRRLPPAVVHARRPSAGSRSRRETRSRRRDRGLPGRGSRPSRSSRCRTRWATGPLALDRWPLYLALLGIGVVAYVLRLVDLLGRAPGPSRPVAGVVGRRVRTRAVRGGHLRDRAQPERA